MSSSRDPGVSSWSTWGSSTISTSSPGGPRVGHVTQGSTSWSTGGRHQATYGRGAGPVVEVLAQWSGGGPSGPAGVGGGGVGGAVAAAEVL